MIAAESRDGGARPLLNGRTSGRRVATTSITYNLEAPGLKVQDCAEIKKDSCCGRVSCGFALCLLVSILILFTAFVTAFFIIARNFESADGNATGFDKARDTFFETWEPSEEVIEKARMYFRRDRANLTVWLLDFGHWELDTLLTTNSSKEELNNYIEQQWRRHRGSYVPPNLRGYYRDQNIAQTWAMIVNMDGYSFAKAMDLTAIGYLQELLKAHSSNLNTLEYGIVINMASWSRFLLTMIKPVMGETMDKFELFGYQEWLLPVLDRMGDSELPPGFGAYAEDDHSPDDEDDE